MKSVCHRSAMGHRSTGWICSPQLSVGTLAVPLPSCIRGQRLATPTAESHVTKRSNLRRARHGFSLIEMVVVISMLTVMLSLAGMTFHLLLQSEKQVTQSFVTERVVSQLAIQFRDDAHQSTSAVVTGDPDSATSKMALGRSSGTWCRYVSTTEGVTRLLLKDDSVVSREDYRLPECLVSFTAGEGADASIRTLLIDRPGIRLIKKERMPPPRRLLRIDAHLGHSYETADALIPAINEAAPATDADAASSSDGKEEAQ